MSGRTHMMVGIAAALAVAQPKSVSGIILSVGSGALGALISDIDVGTSGSHREADRITVLSFLVVLAVILSDHFFHTGILTRVVNNSGYMRIMAGAFLFVAICAFGKEQPHRSFMHSFAALILLGFALGLIWEQAVVPFAAGFLSHLATDIFNKKKVRLWYPLKGGVALKLFHAHGTANTVLFTAGSAVAAVELIIFTVRLLL